MNVPKFNDREKAFEEEYIRRKEYVLTRISGVVPKCLLYPSILTWIKTGRKSSNQPRPRRSLEVLAARARSPATVRPKM
jgi:hypothetical protein